MLRKTESRHISNYSFTSPLDLSRRVAIRRRLIESKRQTEQSQETQVINTSQVMVDVGSLFVMSGTDLTFLKSGHYQMGILMNLR